MNKNVKILAVLLLIGMLLAWPIGYFITKLEKPAAEKQLAEMDKLAGDLLALTKKGDLDGAGQKIKKLAEKFPNQTLPVSIRIESLNAITQSILAAKKGFFAAKTDQHMLLWQATQVRVAIDSLSHANQPMWRNYYASYANQMQNLMQSAVERDLNEFRAQFDENYRLYLAIKPAMGVQLKEEEMNQIGLSYEQLGKELRNETIEWQTIRDALRELNANMQKAFDGADKSTLAAMIGPDSPVTLVLSIAAVVIMALSYVAWKKYDAQQARII